MSGISGVNSSSGVTYATVQAVVARPIVQEAAQAAAAKTNSSAGTDNDGGHIDLKA
jgi:hypothetical protein